MDYHRELKHAKEVKAHDVEYQKWKNWNAKRESAIPSVNSRTKFLEDTTWMSNNQEGANSIQPVAKCRGQRRLGCSPFNQCPYFTRKIRIICATITTVRPIARNVFRFESFFSFSASAMWTASNCSKIFALPIALAASIKLWVFGRLAHQSNSLVRPICFLA